MGVTVSSSVKKKTPASRYQLRVKRSKTGKGLFTQVPIKKGARIIEYTGKVVTNADRRLDWGKYFFEVGKNKVIDGNIPSNLARYINHSCVPNCEADGPEGKVYISALRNIKPGEELTYDYGEEYFDKHIGAAKCKCPKHSKLLTKVKGRTK